MQGFFRTAGLSLFLAVGAGGNASPGSHINQYGSNGMNVFVVESGTMSFGVSENAPPESDFFVNANFFDSDGPIGLVVVDGVRKSRIVDQKLLGITKELHIGELYSDI